MTRLTRLLVRLTVAALVAAGVTAAGTAPAQAASCVSYVYGSGGSGQCVKNIQIMLNGITAEYNYKTYPYGCNGLLSTEYLTTDGQFGPRTKAKVVSFQYWTCNSPDGIVGRATWRDLCGYAGQIAFRYYPSAKPKQYAAWQAARNSGCAVE